MKKLKKLLSVLLAGAMALSLCATALANEPATPSEPTAVTEFGDDTSGSINAQSTRQGALPAKPISIILPTVATVDRDAGEMQLFDFYLDPHNLIAKTNAAEFAEEGKTTPKFDPAAKLYFASDVASEEDFNYSGTSKSLTVTNTGFVDLDVDLDLAFDRDGAEFDLVDSAEDLSADAGASAQMYLAVVGGGQTVPVLDPADDAVPTVKATDDPSYLAAGDDVAEPVVEYVPFDPEGTTEEDEYKALKAAFDKVLAGASITLTYTATVEDDPETTSEDESAAPELAIDVAGTGTDAYTVAYSDGTDPITGSIAGDSGVVVAFTIADEDGNDVDLANITFSVAFPEAGSEADVDGEQTLTFDVPHTGAKVETALGVLADSYALAQTSDTDTIASLREKNVDVTTKGYYWEQKEKDTTKYPAFTFNLVGNINEALEAEDSDVSPWDAIDTNIGFEMTWDVTPYNKTQGRTKLYDAANGEGGGTVESVEPTVHVTKKASSTSGTNATATMTWTDGTGDYAGYTPTSAKNGAGKTIALSNSDHTISLTATTTNKTNKACVITFTKAGADAIEITPDDNWFA